jgi:S1-C subfamily serine protease
MDDLERAAFVIAGRSDGIGCVRPIAPACEIPGPAWREEAAGGGFRCAQPTLRQLRQPRLLRRLWWWPLLVPGLCTASRAPSSEPLDLVRAEENRRTEVFQRAARSVVCIFEDAQATAGGSGVLIDPAGYGLTNVHVVQSLLATRRGVAGLSDGRLYPLRVIGIDPGGDIALFRLEGRSGFDFAPLGDSDQLYVGQPVAAMGNPFMLAEDFTPTITLGVISGLHRYQSGQGNLLEYADCIQVSTSINPGNSGGPLFDLEGRVVGINGRASFAEERQRVNVGLGYAVTINQIRRFLPGLRAGRLVEHGTLGATVRAAGRELIFDAIQDFSPAEKAGVQPGDVLVSLDGRPVYGPNDFNNRIAILPADWPVHLRLRREGREFESDVRLERVPLAVPIVYVPEPQVQSDEMRRLLADHRRAMSADGPIERLEWSGNIGDGSSGRTERLRVRHEPLRRLTVAVDGSGPVMTTDYEPSGPPEDRGDGVTPTLSGALWQEWMHVLDPLLAPPQPAPDWEALGGDLIDGRIVCVLQRRYDSGRRIRWLFDLESGALRRVCLGDADSPCRTVWTPAGVVPSGSLSLPQLWTRTAEDGRELTLRIEEVGAEIAGTPVRPAAGESEP